HTRCYRDWSSDVCSSDLFGGSCLPKDLRALTYRAKELDLKLPLLESILPSNAEHIDRAAEAILAFGMRRIGVLGLSFKPGTDDRSEERRVGKECRWQMES